MTGDSGGDERLEIAYLESRNVIDAQRETMSDIDGKAVSTVRLTVLVVGVVVTAARIGGPSLFHPHLLAVGVGSLLFATVVGVFTYTESNLFLGPNLTYLTKLADGDVAAWEEDLVVRFAHWIDDNHRDIQWNGRLLFATQVGLALGVVAVALAVGL